MANNHNRAPKPPKFSEEYKDIIDLDENGKKPWREAVVRDANGEKVLDANGDDIVVATPLTDYEKEVIASQADTIRGELPSAADDPYAKRMTVRELRVLANEKERAGYDSMSAGEQDMFMHQLLAEYENNPDLWDEDNNRIYDVENDPEFRAHYSEIAESAEHKALSDDEATAKYEEEKTKWVEERERRANNPPGPEARSDEDIKSDASFVAAYRAKIESTIGEDAYNALSDEEKARKVAEFLEAWKHIHPEQTQRTPEDLQNEKIERLLQDPKFAAAWGSFLGMVNLNENNSGYKEALAKFVANWEDDSVLEDGQQVDYHRRAFGNLPLQIAMRTYGESRGIDGKDEDGKSLLTDEQRDAINQRYYEMYSQYSSTGEQGHFAELENVRNRYAELTAKDRTKGILGRLCGKADLSSSEVQPGDSRFTRLLKGASRLFGRVRNRFADSALGQAINKRSNSRINEAKAQYEAQAGSHLQGETGRATDQVLAANNCKIDSNGKYVNVDTNELLSDEDRERVVGDVNAAILNVHNQEDMLFEAQVVKSQAEVSAKAGSFTNWWTRQATTRKGRVWKSIAKGVIVAGTGALAGGAVAVGTMLVAGTSVPILAAAASVGAVKFGTTVAAGAVAGSRYGSRLKRRSHNVVVGEGDDAKTVTQVRSETDITSRAGQREQALQGIKDAAYNEVYGDGSEHSNLSEDEKHAKLVELTNRRVLELTTGGVEGSTETVVDKNKREIRKTAAMGAVGAKAAAYGAAHFFHPSPNTPPTATTQPTTPGVNKQGIDSGVHPNEGVSPNSPLRGYGNTPGVNPKGIETGVHPNEGTIDPSLRGYGNPDHGSHYPYTDSPDHPANQQPTGGDHAGDWGGHHNPADDHGNGADKLDAVHDDVVVKKGEGYIRMLGREYGLTPEQAGKLHYHLEGKFGGDYIDIKGHGPDVYNQGGDWRLMRTGPAELEKGVPEEVAKWMTKQGIVK